MDRNYYVYILASKRNGTLTRILEAIYDEADFLDVSYGFRRGKKGHEAVDEVYAAIMVRPTNWIADVDIERYFDTVDHEKLMKVVGKRIADPNILRLIKRFLKAGYAEKGKKYSPEEGTPQGAVLSPLLANVYLHYCLDMWFEHSFKREARGYCQLIRYADDFVVCFQKKADADRFRKELRKRMARFGLKVSKEKSWLLPFGRKVLASAQRAGRKVGTFDFLGFTHFCTHSRKGNFLVGRKTAKKKYRLKLRELNKWLKGIRNCIPLKEWWPIFAQKLGGHFRYYGIGGNTSDLQSFYYCAIHSAFKWINRRSQKRSYNWEQFCRFLDFYPLPRPKIFHRYPVLW